MVAPPHGSSLHGCRTIAAERRRQIDVEGWSMDHDQEHDCGELISAAACYMMAADYWRVNGVIITFDDLKGLLEWPWDEKDWKPSDDPMRNLAKAGALIAAEIDRLNYRRVLDAQNAEEADNDGDD